jgi:hypothetical protein
MLYNTASGMIMSVADMPYWADMYLGSQNRKNHHTPSVMNLPKAKAQVWR